MAFEWKRQKPGAYHAKIGYGYGYDAVACRLEGGLWTWGIFKGAQEITHGSGSTLYRAKYHAENAASKITVKQTNLMSQTEFDMPITTPWCCNPASETYWSM